MERRRSLQHSASRGWDQRSIALGNRGECCYGVIGDDLARHGRQRLRRRWCVEFDSALRERSRPGELLHLDLKYLPDLNNPRPDV